MWFMCNLGARDRWRYLIYRIQSNISPYGEAKPRSLSTIIMCLKYDKTKTLPATYFLEPLHNSIKVWSFLWVIIPAIHHQINILWLYLNARNVGAKWRVFMHNHSVNDFCVKKITAIFCVEWWSEQIIGTLRFATTRLRFDFELESYNCFLDKGTFIGEWGTGRLRSGLITTLHST